MVITLVVLALLTGLGTGAGAAVAVGRGRRDSGPSAGVRQLAAMREQLQTEHAVALASSDTRASLAAGAPYPWSAVDRQS
jgi:hypothetical protein